MGALGTRDRFIDDELAISPRGEKMKFLWTKWMMVIYMGDENTTDEESVIISVHRDRILVFIRKISFVQYKDCQRSLLLAGDARFYSIYFETGTAMMATSMDMRHLTSDLAG